MSAAFIITLRETLEIALIVGILLAYLSKTLNENHKKFVWWGLLGGMVFSGILAFVFQQLFGGFEGRVEELYEGVTMLIAAGLLTWMILWMFTQRRNMRRNIEDKVQAHLEKDHYWGILLLSFVATAREGIETGIFLQAAALQSAGEGMLLGGLLGIGVAVLVSYVLFKGSTKISLKKFFTATTVLLILFGAGLVAHGFHELQEASVFPVLRQQLWDINPQVLIPGVYPLWHEDGTVGSFLKSLFGYNGNPSLLEVLSYVGYLSLTILIGRRILRIEKATT